MSVTAGLEDFHLRKVHDPIEPIHDIVQGARAYAHHAGLADPHEGIDYHKVRTHGDLLGELAHHYDSLPADDPSAHKHFDAMRDEVNRQHDFLTHKMGYKVRVVDHDPYQSVHDLRADVAKNKRIQVMGTHVTGGHPYFSNEDNDRFRAVHDIFGHLATGRDFDAHGEEAAFQAHSRMFSHRALPAMTSETRGQNGSLIANGRFGPQKIAVMPRRLWHPGLAHEAKVDWEEFRLLQHAQDVRSERAGIGGSKEDRDVYFGLGEHGGRGQEHRVNPKEWIKHSREPGLEDQPPEFQEHSRGYQLGRAHGQTGKVNPEELDREFERSPHPDHFSDGYQDGLEETLSRTATSGAAWSDYDTGPNANFRMGRDIHIAHPSGDHTGRIVDRTGPRSFVVRVHEPEDAHPEPGSYVHLTSRGETRSALVRGYHSPRSYEVTEREQPVSMDKNSTRTVAVLVGGMDDMPKGMQVTAHVSGNQIDVLHCPFCGSGAVIARSDGTIECGYCTSIFTVQVQPAYAGFPQSVDGQPYQWPGMPDPNSVMAPDAPPGTNVNPLAQDPMAAGAGAPPLGDGGLLGVDGGGAPESSDPSEGGFGEDEEGDDDSEGGGNPFAKGKDKGSDDKKSDKKSDDKKSDKKPPQKKSSLLLKTASGAQLDAAEFEAHLAMKYAQNPLVVAQRVREARAKGLL